MSVSLRSVESILEIASRFYRKNLPLAYSQQAHISILLDIIGYVIHELAFPVVITSVPLAEPIFHLDKTIILSKSLIAYYMNQPIITDTGSVTLRRNVDLFDDLFDGGGGGGAEQTATTDAKTRSATKPPSSSSSSRSTIKTACLRANRLDLSERFDELEYIRFANIVKLVVMVAHWYQHYAKSIPYTDHSRFRSFELANRESSLSGFARFNGGVAYRDSERKRYKGDEYDDDGGGYRDDDADDDDDDYDDRDTRDNDYDGNDNNRGSRMRVG